MRHSARAAVAAVALLSACSSSSTAPPPTTVTTTTAAPATTTTAVPQIPQSTPDAAATMLLNAWAHGDRVAAARVATASAVTQLFANPPQGFSDRGCQTPTAGMSSCAFGVGNSQLIAVHTVTIDGGWLVDGVTIE